MKILKELWRAKRAFSPVIASLILMLLAVAAGVVVYAYVMGWLGGATQTPGGTKGAAQFDSLYAKDHGTDHITVWVRNIGQKELTLGMIYVDGTAYTNETSTGSTNPYFDDSEVAVPITDVVYIYLETSCPTLTKHLFYEVKVTFTDGTTASQSVEAK